MTIWRTGHIGAQEFRAQQRCNKSGQILLSRVSMRRYKHAALGVPAGLFSACCSCEQYVVQSDEAEKTMLPFVFDEDDGGHTWPGDTDLLSTSGKSRCIFQNNNYKTQRNLRLKWRISCRPWRFGSVERVLLFSAKREALVGFAV